MLILLILIVAFHLYFYPSFMRKFSNQTRIGINAILVLLVSLYNITIGILVLICLFLMDEHVQYSQYHHTIQEGFVEYFTMTETDPMTVRTTKKVLENTPEDIYHQSPEYPM